VERTVEFARQTKAFDFKELPQTLHVAIDSSPLKGASRVGEPPTVGISLLSPA
jgi:hypothetical protein